VTPRFASHLRHYTISQSSSLRLPSNCDPRNHRLVTSYSRHAARSFLKGFALLCSCAALFFLVAALGEPIETKRLGSELAVMIVAMGFLTWSWLN
jgi:hypothetical protein